MDRLRVLRSFKPWRADGYLHLIESVMRARSRPPVQPQLFIIGPPRTGTTLIYQYIVHRLSVAHFTNAVGRYPFAPCLVSYVQKRLWGSYVSDFKSQYGKVQNPLGPREAGGFWNRHFHSESYQQFGDISPQGVRTLRHTIWCMQRIYNGAPFVNKNVKHLLRIPALREIFPECIFLVVERDLVDTALSLYRARQALLDGQDKWLSVRPPNYETLKDLPPAEQVVRQLLSLREKLEEDISALNAENVVRVNYENFCDRPDYLIELLEPSFGKIAERNPAQDCFIRSERHPRTDEERALVQLSETLAASINKCAK